MLKKLLAAATAALIVSLGFVGVANAVPTSSNGSMSTLGVWRYCCTFLNFIDCKNAGVSHVFNGASSYSCVENIHAAWDLYILD